MTSYFGSWFTSLSRVLPTSRVGYHAAWINMSFQQLVKKLSDNSVLFSCSIRHFFYLILFFFLPSLFGCRSSFGCRVHPLAFIFKVFLFVKLSSIFVLRVVRTPKHFLLNFVGTFLARFKFSKLFELPYLRFVVILLPQKWFFEWFWRILSSPFTVPYIRRWQHIAGKVIQHLFNIDLYTYLAIYRYKWNKR